MTVRRLKTYTSDQGYVYQYYFVGKRSLNESSGRADEYVFDVSSDRKTMQAVSVSFPEAARLAWTRAHSRSLSDAEQYAAAKLLLLKAFDDSTDAAIDPRLFLTVELLDELLARVGID